MALPQAPYYLIQISYNESESLGKILNIPPSIVTVRQAQKTYGANWKEFLSFSITRNPFTRAIAIYEDYFNSNKFGILEHNISFLTFLNLTLKHKKKPYFDRPSIFRSQWYWLKNYKGEQGVMMLGKHELYYEAVYTFLSFLGRDPSIISRKTVQPLTDWQHYYEGIEGRMAADMIRYYWSEDFKHLDYENRTT